MANFTFEKVSKKAKDTAKKAKKKA